MLGGRASCRCDVERLVFCRVIALRCKSYRTTRKWGHKVSSRPGAAVEAVRVQTRKLSNVQAADKPITNLKAAGAAGAEGCSAVGSAVAKAKPWYIDDSVQGAYVSLGDSDKVVVPGN